MPLFDKQYLQINQALFSLTHAYESRMAKEEERNVLDLTLADCSVLMVLHQFAPLNSRRLSRIMDINPGTISVYVQRLVEKGLLQKQQECSSQHWLKLMQFSGNILDNAEIPAVVSNLIANCLFSNSLVDGFNQMRLVKCNLNFINAFLV